MPLSPPSQDHRAGLALLAVLMLSLTLLRLTVRSALDIDLRHDEAELAMMSFQPDWGYHSNPPLTAWAIGASRQLCGDSGFCVRLPSAVALTLAPLLVFSIGRELWPRLPGIAWVGAGLFALSPVAGFHAMFTTSHALLLLFWAVALLSLLRAIREGGSWWLSLGVALGLGLLADYGMAIFAISMVLALVLIPQLRLLLPQPGPAVAMFAAVLLFSPNLWWNAVNGFPIWQESTGSTGRLAGLVAFLAAQVALFGPIAFVAAAVAVRQGLAADSPPLDVGPGQAVRIPPFRLLVCFTLPFLVYAALQSAFADTALDAAAPAFLSASLLAASVLIATRLRWLVGSALLTAALLSALACGHEPVARAAGWSLQSPLAALRGWAALGAEVEQLALQHRSGLVVDDPVLAAELGFYGGSSGSGLRVWNPEGLRDDHFRLTRDLANAPTRDGTFLVLSRRDIEPGLTAAFAELVPLDTRLQLPGAAPGQTLQAWLARGFLGYP